IERSGIKIRANNITLLGSRNNSNGNDGSTNNQPQEQNASNTPATSGEENNVNGMDDLPF
ncbi:MAG: hypothetical protein ACK44D_11680, partial [Bacteroidia bacterium]